MKLSITIAIIAMTIASTNVSANAFDNDYYEDNLLPSEINTNVDMKIHGDHFEGMNPVAELKTNIPLTCDDVRVYDDDEYHS